MQSSKNACSVPNAAALLSVLTVTFLLVGPATWLIPAFVGEALAAVRSVDWLPRVPEIVTQFLESLAIPSADIESTVDAAVRNARGFLAEQSARLAGDVAAWAFDLIVMLFAMFYLFRDGPRVVRLIRDVSPMGGDHRDLMFRQVSELGCRYRFERIGCRLLPRLGGRRHFLVSRHRDAAVLGRGSAGSWRSCLLSGPIWSGRPSGSACWPQARPGAGY